MFYKSINHKMKYVGFSMHGWWFSQGITVWACCYT